MPRPAAHTYRHYFSGYISNRYWANSLKTTAIGGDEFSNDPFSRTLPQTKSCVKSLNLGYCLIKPREVVMLLSKNRLFCSPTKSSNLLTAFVRPLEVLLDRVLNSPMGTEALASFDMLSMNYGLSLCSSGAADMVIS